MMRFARTRTSAAHETAALTSPMEGRGLLLFLAVANFVIGMGAFVVVGILPPVASAFGRTAGEAGLLMTLYALVYAVSSPLLVTLTGQFPRKGVLCAGLSLFGAGALGATLAPNWTLLLGARALMAVGGGLVTPVAASLAVALSRSEDRGKALSIVFGGLTLAQVLGVPAGAWLGYSFGWQMAFGLVALIACGAALLVSSLPLSVAVPATGLASLAQVGRSLRLVAAILFTGLFIGGIYCVYTFLAPLLETRHALGRDGVAAVLLAFGAGAVFGNAGGGFLTDRLGSVPTLLILCAAQVLILPALTIVSAGIATTALLVVAMSIFGWSFMVPQQARLSTLDPSLTPVLFALNAAAIYLGASVGSAVGGALLSAGSFPLVGLAGAVMVGMAALSLAFVRPLPSPLRR